MQFDPRLKDSEVSLARILEMREFWQTGHEDSVGKTQERYDKGMKKRH